jgi:signal transduction histidine kinase
METLLSGKAGALTSEQETYIRHSYESNERMIALVGDLLRTSRLDEYADVLTKKEVDIVSLIREIEVDLTGMLHKKNITLAYDTPEHVHVSIDPKSMREVFMNIISNAIKYSHEGSVIGIHYTRGNSRHVVSIQDSGIGIPHHMHSRIFERFFRAPNASQAAPDGNGLGLYIARTIVERHGGKLSFTSIEGQGTTFFIELP